MDMFFLMALVIATITVIVTALLCRQRISRGRDVPWGVTIIGLVCATMINSALFIAPDVFNGSFWRGGKGAGPLVVLIYCFGFSGLVGLLPAICVVAYYR